MTAIESVVRRQRQFQTSHQRETTIYMKHYPISIDVRGVLGAPHVNQSIQTNVLKPNYTGSPLLGVLEILIPVTALAWVLVGAGCILHMNGRRLRAGLWLPEWYLTSRGTAGDKVLVVCWWAGVILGWPVIIVGMLIGKAVSGARRLFVMKQHAMGGKELSDDEDVYA